MPQVAVRVSKLSKQYAVGTAHQAPNTLYDLLTSRLTQTWRKPRGQDLPAPEQSKLFWALRDVNFEIGAGEVVGVVGRNGAGKSTLLKVLSRITAPSSGRIEVRGRLASLLEVGTGFHPELSGRENIYLNGALLGMTKGEIARKFDEIVAFAEVDKFIDTPVKRYSSGMYVRLAFAVAAHLETDVLLVDEVLAVGDASFQRKSLGKMSDVARRGRTVLFVSHNLAAVRNLCARSMLIEDGALRFDGPTSEALAIYERKLGARGGKLAGSQFKGALSDQVMFREIRFIQCGDLVNVLDPQLEFTIELHATAARDFNSLDMNIALFRDGFHITTCFDTKRSSCLRKGPVVSRFHLGAGIFRPGRYTLGVGAFISSEWIWGPDVAALDFSENLAGQPAARMAGAVALPYEADRVQELVHYSSGIPSI